MEADIFRDVLVPVIGGLGLFMLGLEYMTTGIQSLAVNKMRALMARIAGTPVTGLFAGTVVTAVIHSSTAVTVMVVGLVNAGVLGLRPAIGVIMGANIGTTIGNSLVALPLGPFGLLLGGLCALVYVFASSDRVRNIALAIMGFALTFYGLSLMTGGLRPVRGMPEVMAIITGLHADSFFGLVSCVLIAAFITAVVHSSSATLCIVMGLGSSGFLDWLSAVAFSLGADLGTTVTSWIASLNLTRNAKRAAYAHISFNLIGVVAVLPIFVPSLEVLRFTMQWFGGDPAVPTLVNGKETFPLVPVAVGLYSTGFNIFNTLLLFPFIDLMHRLLSRVGHTNVEDKEDYSRPKYLDEALLGDIKRGVAAVQQELARHLEGTVRFLDIARGNPDVPESEAHAVAMDVLNRDIRQYTSRLFELNLPSEKTDLIASLIKEQDWAAHVGTTLHQIARRVERLEFSSAGRKLVNETVDEIVDAFGVLAASHGGTVSPEEATDVVRRRLPALVALRERCLHIGPTLPWSERGAILTLLGSAERAFHGIERIASERYSLTRAISGVDTTSSDRGPDSPGAAVPVPA